MGTKVDQLVGGGSEIVNVYVEPTLLVVVITTGSRLADLETVLVDVGPEMVVVLRIVTG